MTGITTAFEAPTRARGRSNEPDDTGTNRLTILRRHRLPSGRAVLGALLVTGAFLGVFAYTQQPTADPGSTYVVAAAAIDAGEVIEAADLELRTLTLDTVVDARAFNQRDTLIGAVAVAPLSVGDLIQQSDVRESFSAATASAPADQLTLVAPDGRTPPGLARGEAVMILATLGTGDRSLTVVVAEAATVVDIVTNDNPLASDGRTITVSIPTRAETIETANAAINGDLTIVRAGEGLDGPTGVRLADQIDAELP